MEAVRLLVAGVLWLAAQFFVFQNLALQTQAFSLVGFLYVWFWPLTGNRVLGLVFAFGYGLVWDHLNGVIGAHAAACTFLYAVRPYWLRVVSPVVTEEELQELSFRAELRSVSWLITYVVPAAFTYSLVYFLHADFGVSGNTLLKGLLSGLYSSVLGLLLVVVFYRR